MRDLKKSFLISLVLLTVIFAYALNKSGGKGPVSLNAEANYNKISNRMDTFGTEKTGRAGANFPEPKTPNSP